MTTLTTHPGFTLDYRARALRGLAERWDNTIFENDRWLLDRDFTQQERNRSTDDLIDRLTTTAAEYADVLMTRVDIRSYMEELRDAVNALTRYETGNGWDGDDDPDYSNATDDEVLDRLNGDIDLALWPLLFGMSTMNVCFWCSRHKPNVTTWNVREPGAPCCVDCGGK